ncbi:signal recognition particle domain-containing protein [Cystoisospora suis]|uniref:Signal recognition particle domain-containing protein n=1 Tax=Cystoisospora suis TaxID=483139 RepID=A0A2C6KHZ9_9APIC|nr:signal recognition particle domain-containing protein [Cystoisospora suis]
MIKYRREAGELKLKVTDNVTCLKYRASSPADLKNIDRFGRMFLQWTLIKSISSPDHLPLDLLPGSGKETKSSSSSQRHSQGSHDGEPPKKTRRRKRGD